MPESEKDDIEARMEKAEAQVEELIRHLAGQGFHKAAQYLNRSRRYMFSYLRRWLQFGIACPRASSLIERFFRELGRRIKKLGYNWKAAGVGKITRIILKKYTRPQARASARNLIRKPAEPLHQLLLLHGQGAARNAHLPRLCEPGVHRRARVRACLSPRGRVA